MCTLTGSGYGWSKKKELIDKKNIIRWLTSTTHLCYTNCFSSLQCARQKRKVLRKCSEYDICDLNKIRLRKTNPMYTLWQFVIGPKWRETTRQRRKMLGREEKLFGRAGVCISEEHCTCGPPSKISITLSQSISMHAMLSLILSGASGNTSVVYRIIRQGRTCRKGINLKHVASFSMFVVIWFRHLTGFRNAISQNVHKR